MGMSLMLCFCGLFGLWGCGVGGVCLLHGWLTGFVLVGWLCVGVSGWFVLVGCLFVHGWLVFLLLWGCWLVVFFGVVLILHFFVESLILAQDERWRRA